MFLLFALHIIVIKFIAITWVFWVLNVPNCPSWELAMAVQLFIMSNHSKWRKSTTFNQVVNWWWSSLVWNCTRAIIIVIHTHHNCCHAQNNNQRRSCHLSGFVTCWANCLSCTSPPKANLFSPLPDGTWTKLASSLSLWWWSSKIVDTIYHLIESEKILNSFCHPRFLSFKIIHIRDSSLLCLFCIHHYHLVVRRWLVFAYLSSVTIIWLFTFQSVSPESIMAKIPSTL